MRAVVQRVSEAAVTVDGTVTGALDAPGLVVLLGVTHTDTPAIGAALAAKIWQLRIMQDEKSAADLGAGVLVVSQFTLYADTRKGRRPSWSAAAPGAVSEPIYESFCASLSDLGADVQTGVFGGDMAVSLVNDGPVTILLDSDA
jgi:D-tyrosyl-tRNA(Tyr) deacylase